MNVHLRVLHNSFSMIKKKVTYDKLMNNVFELSENFPVKLIHFLTTVKRVLVNYLLLEILI